MAPTHRLCLCHHTITTSLETHFAERRESVVCEDVDASVVGLQVVNLLLEDY
jgi:hypothetical protein